MLPFFICLDEREASASLGIYRRKYPAVLRELIAPVSAVRLSAEGKLRSEA